MIRILGLGVLALAMSSSARAFQNTGNQHLGSSTAGVPVMPMSSADKAALISAVRTFVDPQTGDDLEVALDPQVGNCQLVDYWGDGPGASDGGTIGVNVHSGLPMYFLAIVTAHEFVHQRSARSNDPNNPDGRDPATNPSTDNCWDCRHAQMSAYDCALLSNVICNIEGAILQESLVEACKHWQDTYDTAADRLCLCHDEGCAACCGFSAIPDVSQIATKPSCCP